MNEVQCFVICFMEMSENLLLKRQKEKKRGGGGSRDGHCPL
jgi:hypothetical protein